MTFTIDAQNNITAHDTPEQAAAAAEIPFERFSTQKELAKIAADWPTNRFVEIWNGMAGAPPFGKLKPVKKFTDRASAITRLWNVIHILSGDPTKDIAALEAYVAAKKAAQDAPEAAAATKTTTAKNAPKAKRAAKAKGPSAPRDGSKTAQVLAMLQRKNGATLSEIMGKMGWQKHTVRGFMAGTMKGAGYAVESFKPDKGERTYRINS